MQQSAALRARFTIFTSRASQFRARPFSNRCGFAVYTTSKPYRFENAPLLKAYSKRPGSDNELDRRRVNERITASKPMRLQMKPRPCIYMKSADIECLLEMSLENKASILKYPRCELSNKNFAIFERKIERNGNSP